MHAIACMLSHTKNNINNVYCLCDCALLDREFDADRHCGVWVEDTGRQCTHSLTCKVEHQLGVCGTQ